MKLLTPQPLLDHFGLANFVCLDFETTGLDFATCDIIEAGALKIKDGEIVDQFNSLIWTDDEISETITNLTGISKYDLEGQPKSSEVIPKLVDFIGDSPIIAHNLKFDLGFLKEVLLRLGEFGSLNDLELDSDKHWDILLFSRMIFPLFQSHRLEALIDSFEIKSDTQHRALDDTKAEIQIFDRVLLKSIEIPTDTLATLVQVTQGRKKFYSRFVRSLHDFRTKKYHIFSENSLSNFVVNYPTSQNVLLRNTNKANGSERQFDSQEVTSVFDQNGSLSNSLDSYEYRQEQIDMVSEICRAYENQEFLMVEAGTGTGKSYAYLTPAIYWSLCHPHQEGRTVISTNTKNLQDQIFYKDLPFLHKNLPVNFQSVLLKGRSNYLCLNRWNKFLTHSDFATDPFLLEDILPLVVWVHQTNTGDIEETNWLNSKRSGKIWSQIQSDGYLCSNQACRFKDQCFVNRARRASREAEIVVINHSLLLSDLISDNAVLSDYSNLVIDEAHNLENIATQYLGKDWSFWSLNQLTLSLDNSGGEIQNELDSFIAFLQKQKWIEKSEQKSILLNFDQVKQKAVNLRTANNDFFKQVYLELSHSFVEKSGYSKKIRYQNWLQEFSSLEEHTNELFAKLEILFNEISRLVDNLSGLQVSKFSEDNREIFEANFAFVQGTGNSLSELRETMQQLFVENVSQFVFWIENVNRKDKQDIHFRSAPLEVGSLLKNMMYDNLSTVVFTSATLSINQEFNFFQNRLGLDLLPLERQNFKTVGSPFDFKEQVKILIPTFTPNPKESKYLSITSEIIKNSILETERSTLALFTSYKMLDFVFENVNQSLKEKNLVAVAQGRSGSRNNLLRMLREKKAIALFGTHSFWEGIDLPGDALEILIITKLPFEVPSEPIVQARIEQIEQLGGNSFYEYSLPNAILKFRQGFGRLIRSQNDRGVVILLDSRLISARYGNLFLNSMPTEATVVENMEEFIYSLKNWFSV